MQQSNDANNTSSTADNRAVRAFQTAQRLLELDQALLVASQEEIHFDMFVQHYLSQAGQRELKRSLRRWLEFLRWCAAPERAAVVKQHKMDELVKLGREVRLRLRCRQSPLGLQSSHTVVWHPISVAERRSCAPVPPPDVQALGVGGRPAGGTGPADEHGRPHGCAHGASAPGQGPS